MEQKIVNSTIKILLSLVLKVASEDCVQYGSFTSQPHIILEDGECQAHDSLLPPPPVKQC